MVICSYGIISVFGSIPQTTILKRREEESGSRIHTQNRCVPEPGFKRGGGKRTFDESGRKNYLSIYIRYIYIYISLAERWWWRCNTEQCTINRNNIRDLCMYAMLLPPLARCWGPTRENNKKNNLRSACACSCANANHHNKLIINNTHWWDAVFCFFVMICPTSFSQALLICVFCVTKKETLITTLQDLVRVLLFWCVVQ